MISPHAIVETDEIGTGVTVGPFAVVRQGVSLEDGATIHPHTVIEPGCVIGAGTEVFPGTYLGKAPKGAGATAKSHQFEQWVSIGADCVVGPNAVVYYDVAIGDNTLIGDGASIREKCRIGSSCIVSRYVTINYNTTVGDRTKIMDLTHITGNAVIGNDVFISLTVGTVNDNAIGRLEYNEDRVKGQIIEDGAAIGAGATLLPGVRIGQGATVGAGSVVTRDVAPESTVMGIPARPVSTSR